MFNYFCPICGHNVSGNIFFQFSGQCLCSVCNEVVDLTNVITSPDEAYKIERDYIKEIEDEYGGLPI